MTMSFDEWMNQPEYVITSDSEKLCEGDVFYALFGPTDYAVRGVCTRIDCDIADGDYGLPVRWNTATVALDNGLTGYVTMEGDGHTHGSANSDASEYSIPFETVTPRHIEWMAEQAATRTPPRYQGHGVENEDGPR